MLKTKKSSKIQIIPVENIGKDDINFPEFCFGIIGKTDISNQPSELVFVDKLNPDSKITIARGKHGFPNQTTRDLRLALMRLTFQKNQFQSDRVPITAGEVLRELGLKKSGASLKNLRKHLDILTDTRITFENSYFDKITGEKHTQTLKMSTLSGYQIAEIKKVKKDKEKAPNNFEGYILWQQDHFLNSLENSKNLIQFDYPFYLSLNQDITKQLYLFLNKRRYNNSYLRIELQVLAFEKLGISRSLEKKLYNVRYLLKQANDTLIEKGFLASYRFEKDKVTKREYIAYFFNEEIHLQLSDQTVPLLEVDPKWEGVKSRLLSFGLTEGQVGKLFKKYDPNRVLEALELLELQYTGKKVKNPVGLMLECLKGQFDSTPLQAKRQQEKDTEEERIRLQHQEDLRLIAEAEEKAKEVQKQSLIDTWIGKNPGLYYKICEDFLEQEKGQNSTFWKHLLKKEQETSLSKIQIVMDTPYMNQLIRAKIYQGQIAGNKD